VVLARAPHAPRVVGDAPVIAARALLFTPPSGQTWRSYYYAGTQRIAVRVEGDPTPANNGLFYLLSDHLGSTSVTTDASGNKVAELQYYPYGQTRYSWNTTPTSHRFTGQISDEDSTGLYFFHARYYDSALGRFISADTIVPEPGNPQSLNRYTYSLSNPLKYTDPDGHNPILFGLAALGIAYVTGRVVWEVAMNVPVLGQATRDILGGALVTDVSEAITAQAAQQSVDPALVGAVLRLESVPGERRIFTALPLTQPGAAADAFETIEAKIRKGGLLGFASIGPGQMQLRRAEELERLGYVTPRRSEDERIKALLGKETSVEYVAGMLHYLSDQLSTVPGFNDLSAEYQQRLMLLGYNQGWTDAFLKNIQRYGLEGFADKAKYDNQTLDDYLRWLQQQDGK